MSMKTTGGDAQASIGRNKVYAIVDKAKSTMNPIYPMYEKP
jgi:hypothetical protein